MSAEALLRTPLYDQHVKLGGQMVPFAGWEMPVRYGNVREEHMHVRAHIGLFDVSHMGEIRVRGPKSLETLQWLTTNDVSRLKSGQAHYSLFPNAQGGVVDDLIVYCLEPGQEYLLCVNAANTDKDFKFLQDNNRGAELINESHAWGQIAIQGPEAIELIAKVLGTELKELKSFAFSPVSYRGETCYFARTGYTGEDGGEVFVPAALTEALWCELLDSSAGKALPIGLGARDTLRTEMKYPLYGQDIDDQSFPHEAGLGWVVKFDKGDFLGKDKMVAAKEQGLKRTWVGLQLLEPGIARPECQVFSVDSEEVGIITSGTLSPSLNQAIAMAYVSPSQAEVGTELKVQVRNKALKAQVVKTPFYKRG